MAKVETHPSAGYHTYKNRPTVTEDDQLILMEDCERRLAETHDRMTLIEPTPEDDSVEQQSEDGGDSSNGGE